MAVTAQVTSVTKRDSVIYVTFSDGSQFEFASLADVKAWCADVDVAPDLLKRLWVRWWLLHDPSGATAAATIVGKTVTLDLSAANPFKVT